MIDWIKNIISPIGSILDKLTTTDEERLKAQVELKRIEMEITAKVLELEKELAKAQSQIIVSESEGSSWLQRNWRPITMLSFLILIILDSFGLLTYRLSQESWTLLQIGLGGYILGRSLEKTIREYKK